MPLHNPKLCAAQAIVLCSGGWRNVSFEIHDSCGLFRVAAHAEEAIIRAWQTEIVAQRLAHVDGLVDAFSSERKPDLYFKLCTVTRTPLSRRQRCLTERRRSSIRLLRFWLRARRFALSAVSSSYVAFRSALKPDRL